MNKNKRKNQSTQGVRIWETQFYIPSSCESIQYRYGIKNKKNSDIVWEREPNRFCNMKDLKFFKNGVYDPVHDALGLKQKTTISFIFKNSKYIRTDTTFIDDFIYTRITENIGCGPYPYYEEVALLKEKGFKAILNLQTWDNMETLGIDPQRYQEVCQKAQVTYVNIPIIDMKNLNPEKCLQAAHELKNLKDIYNQVYIHCTEGVNRSPIVVIIYLHLFEMYDIWRAFGYVKKKRIRCRASKEVIQNILLKY